MGEVNQEYLDFGWDEDGACGAMDRDSCRTLVHSPWGEGCSFSISAWPDDMADGEAKFAIRGRWGEGEGKRGRDMEFHIPARTAVQIAAYIMQHAVLGSREDGIKGLFPGIPSKDEEVAESILGI